MADLLQSLTAQTYFGSTVVQYLFFLATVGVLIVIAKVASYMVKVKLRSITEKTKTNIDDFMLDLVEQPLWLIAVIIGFAIGAQFLTFNEITALFYQNLLNILAVIIIAWIAVKSVDAFIREFIVPLTSKTDSKLDDQLLPVIRKVVKGIIIVLALLVIIGSFGYDLTAVVAGLGIGGLAFAFAAKETISDMFGGFSIFTSRPFVVGDFVDVNGIVGTVEEVGLRHTRIRNLDKRLVIVPNSKIANSVVTNITTAPKRKCVWHLGVTYDTPVKKVEQAKKIIADAITSHPSCDPDPIVQFEEFGDSSLNILVVFFTKSNDYKQFVKAKNDVGLQIKKEFEKAGIEFAFPTQTIYLQK